MGIDIGISEIVGLEIPEALIDLALGIGRDLLNSTPN